MTAHPEPEVRARPATDAETPTTCRRLAKVATERHWSHVTNDHLESTDAMCVECGPVRGLRSGKFGRYGRQYRYRCPRCEAAVEPATLPGLPAVDLTNPGEVVGDRFAPRTRVKIGMGIERYGGAPFVAELRGGGSTVRPLTAPLSTVTASGTHHLLVTPDGPRVEDARARMAGIAELARVQGFPDDYIWHGNRGDIVRQIGNGVSTTVAEALVGAVVAGLLS